MTIQRDTPSTDEETHQNARALESPASAPGDGPLWSENFCFQAFDPDAGAGVFLHLSRTPYDHDLWRELILVALPDGRVAVAKNFGAGASSAGAGAATLSATCEVPFERVTTTVRTGAHLLTDDRFDDGPLVDGLRESVAVDLAWNTAAPVWNLSENMDDQDWADTHYEVPCRVEGTLRWPGGECRIDAAGIRDHSRGPRDLSGFGRHAWITGLFPDGRAFGLMAVEARGHEMRRAFVHVDGVQHDARLVGDPPLLDAGDPARRPYRLEFDYGVGRAVIEAEPARSEVLSIVPPYEWVLGAHPGPPATHHVYELHTTYSWDGCRGAGLTELTRRLPTGGR